MKTFAAIAAVASTAAAVTAFSGSRTAPAAPQKSAAVATRQSGGLVQSGGIDPLGVHVTVSGTGTIDGTYHAGRIAAGGNSQQYGVTLITPGWGFPQGKIILNRNVKLGVAHWNGGGWYQGSSSGTPSDGSAVGVEFILAGVDPLAGGTVSGSGPWGGTGKTITISVGP